jgi:hypothetical protein
LEPQYFNESIDISPSFYSWFSNKVEPLFDYHNPWEETEEINYKLNNVGLRCDDLSPEPNPENNILFAGCEVTIPIDVKYEDGWAYRVHNEFYKDRSRFVNLSYPGSDSNRIIYNILKYINSYGKPSKMFILMPEIIRAYGWWPEGKGFKPKMYRKEYGDTEHNLMAYPHDISPKLLALKYVQSIFMLEQYCKDTNIDLHWTSWDTKTNNFLKEYGFTGFFYTPGTMNQKSIFNYFKKEIQKND